jgi:hypothetical protein
MTERTALPDLNQLNPEELKTLIVTQHQQLLSKDEQLASRDSEIEQLKLLIAKLQRMQFGRKSEKLERQIERAGPPMRVSAQPHMVRFDAFGVDLRAGELHKHGIRLKLQDQPFRVLAILLDSPLNRQSAHTS